MKVYKVVIDKDGETTKKPGTVSTEIIRQEMFFASESIGEVFNAAILKSVAEDGEIIAVIEVCESVIILPSKETG